MPRQSIQASGADLRCARRAARLREGGLGIASGDGTSVLRLAVVTAGEFTSGYDAIVLAVKSEDLDGAVADIEPAVGPPGRDRPSRFLNEMAHFEPLTGRFGSAVLGGVLRIAAELEEEGTIRVLTPSSRSNWRSASVVAKVDMTRLCGKGLVMADSGDGVTGLPGPGGGGPVILDGMRVLRLCSVFEPAALSGRSAGYDAIGGMHNHTAELSRHLDKLGARQLILTSRLDGPAGRAGFGRGGQVVRTGVDTRLARQGWALLAAPLALGGGPADVVHGHCGEDIAVLPLARLAARRHRCPLVITVHASVRHNLRVTSARTAWLRLAGGPAERRALAAADMVIALTPAAAGRLLGEGIPHSRIRVIPPGYDPDLFAAAAPDPFPDLGRPRVGYIGRIAPQKDVGTLIDAFGRLTGPACLLIVGDGPGRRAAEAQARRLAGPVRFTGFAPHARIPAVLRHIDLLVLATRYEELPSVLIEAMAAGLPVIASRVGGIPALVNYDVNGLLVPPGDPAALAAAISRVLTQPATAARLAAAARQTAQRYTWPGLARQVAAVYLEVTGKPRPP